MFAPGQIVVNSLKVSILVLNGISLVLAKYSSLELIFKLNIKEVFDDDGDGRFFWKKSK
jgi:hypothetical protein